MEDTMKRIMITTVLLLGTAVAAQAVPQTMYKDLIRPNGQKRSDAAYQADVNACYRQTGGSPYVPDGAAIKKCMLSRGYRFMWQRGFASGSRQVAPSGAYDIGPPPDPPSPPVFVDPTPYRPTPVPPIYDSSGNVVQ
jgi:hypothetical protein